VISAAIAASSAGGALGGGVGRVVATAEAAPLGVLGVGHAVAHANRFKPRASQPSRKFMALHYHWGCQLAAR
jgi:hypothetical protein